MENSVKKYNKLVLTDETKEKINAMLEDNKNIAKQNIKQYVDYDSAMEDICSREFYDITRSVMEGLNKHIDFYKDNVTPIFEQLAEDRERLWEKIVKNNYVL